MDQSNIIYIKTHFEFVDICEKNIEHQQSIGHIKNTINITKDILNKENESTYIAIKLLHDKLNRINSLYEKIKDKLIE